MILYIYIYREREREIIFAASTEMFRRVRRALVLAALGSVRQASFAWGFDCDFTNYNFRKALELFQNTLPEG